MIDDARAELLRRVSHDLRSPLGVLRGALDELPFLSSVEERQKIIVLAGRAIERLVRLAERLSLVGIANQGFAPLPQNVELRTTVLAVLSHLSAAEPRARVSTQVEGEAVWQTDPALLFAALAELLSNALRNARSEVRVELSPQEIAVEDDGAGVEAARVGALFGPVVPTRHGLGLGLPLTAAIARSLSLTLSICPARHDGALSRFVVRR